MADGLADDTFDVTNVGKHLNAKEFAKKNKPFGIKTETVMTRDQFN